MLSTATELATYSTATEIAGKYATATYEIRRLLRELREQTGALAEAFQNEGGRPGEFDIRISRGTHEHYDMSEEGIDKLFAEFKRRAWSILIDKLSIKKLMSSNDRESLNDQIRGESRRSGEPVKDLPEIDADTITSVMNGFINTAPEYFEKSIHEIYRWLVPGEWNGGYQTNKRDRVGRRVIKGFCVERGYGGRKFHVSYSRKGEIVALDSIFHTLDGKGVLSGYEGPLVAAIDMSESGNGETEYFKFKCYQNKNLHIEFKREDLLALFNKVACDGHHLGGEMARK